MACLPWPPHNITITTPRVELRLPTDEEYSGLIAQVDESIYANAGVFPFVVDWIGKPAESLRFMWRSKVEWKPEAWSFGLDQALDWFGADSPG